MNGVTGRPGTNQHLIRSIVALCEESGVELPDGERVVPDPILVGRNERGRQALAAEHGVDRWEAAPDLSHDGVARVGGPIDNGRAVIRTR